MRTVTGQEGSPPVPPVEVPKESLPLPPSKLPRSWGLGAANPVPSLRIRSPDWQREGGPLDPTNWPWSFPIPRDWQEYSNFASLAEAAGWEVRLRMASAPVGRFRRRWVVGEDEVIIAEPVGIPQPAVLPTPQEYESLRYFTLAPAEQARWLRPRVLPGVAR